MKSFIHFYKVFLMLLVSCLGVYQASSQTMMPLPPHSRVYTGFARGYWFTAPVDFTITGLRVASQAGGGAQYIQVMRLGTTPPVAFTAQSTNFTNLGYVNGAANGVIQSVNIQVSQGDVIGILGTAGTSNSYSATFFNSNIAGLPVTLSRFGYQGAINGTPAPMYWGVGPGQGGNISRVELYYQLGLKCEDINLDTATIDGPTRVCPNKPFALKIVPKILDLDYKWEKSTDQGNTWTAYSGTPNAQNGGEIKDSILVETWYRCEIRCKKDNKTYVTPIHKVRIAPFYYCYCDNTLSDNDGTDIGNVQMISVQSGDTLINLGKGSPLYNNAESNRNYTAYHDSMGSSFPCMYKDSSYEFNVTQIHAGATFKQGVLQAYLDLNRDGQYDPAKERIFIKAMDGLVNPAELANFTFTRPSALSDTVFGPTGLRFVLSDDTLKVQPCGVISGEGEVEDYIVDLCHVPCSTKVNAGTVVASDTSMCSGYDYMMSNTGYEEKLSAFSRSWQVSGDKITWFDITGSTSKDTLLRTFNGQPLYYRVQAVCHPTDDTSHSTEQLVNVKPGYKCYCYSQATGADKDSSDIGGVDFAGLLTYNGGPHLMNPNARFKRTDYTDDKPVEIFTDSAYKFTVYHTMRSAEHGDAKITIFMDYNNNKSYEIPEERIFTGFTSIGNHTVVDSVIVPLTAIVDVPTGMRVILNNEVGPNIPSDEACGEYPSGETEDFIVIFRKKWAASVGELGNKLNGFGIHPNPTTGKFTVQFDTEEHISDLRIRVTNLTGQEVYSNSYKHNGGLFTEELNLEGQASGVYFIELQADDQQLIRKLVLQ